MIGARRAVLLAIAVVSALLVPARFTVAGSVRALPAVTAADGRLGQDDILHGATPGGQHLPWAQLAYNAGARINRWEFRWDRIEPQPDLWDYSGSDPEVQDAQTYGLQVEGILIGTPAWAAAPGQLPGNGLPRGLYLSYKDPRNLWAQYVRKTVTHFAGKVDAWEVWNEPDIHFFWMGTSENYFQLLKVAYLTVKDADPAATVLLAGMVVPDLAFLSRVLTDANRDPGAQQHNGYFDAAAWHAYGRARLLYSNIQRVRSLLAADGHGGAPIWVTEDGFPNSNPNGEPRQAAYVLQTAAYALAAGASKVLVYRASDDQDPRAWGLVAASGQPRMGYVAFQVAARYFAGGDPITYAPTTHLERFVFFGPNQRVTVLWNRSLTDRTATVDAAGPSARLVDWMGAVSTVTATNAAFRIRVPGASYNFGIDPSGSVVGGPPVLLVESDLATAPMPFQVYLPPLLGQARTLAIVNPNAVPAAVRVATPDHVGRRDVLQIAPGMVGSVNLDLLGGPGYRGWYNLSASSPVQAEAVSSAGAVTAQSAAADWSMPSALGQVALNNPFAQQVSAQLTLFSGNGSLQQRKVLILRANQSLSWTVPGGTAGTVVVHAAAPMLIASVSSRAGAVPAPSSDWYAVSPPVGHLGLFNPNPASPSQVNVRFVGSTAVTGQQLTLGPHATFQLNTHGAGAVLLSASQPIAASYPGTTTLPATQGVSDSSLPEQGAMRRLGLYNPSGGVAHVAVSITGNGQPRQKVATVQPAQLVTLPVRGKGDRPAAVHVSSDVPVVSAPSR